MLSSTFTVRVEHLPGYNALKMTWYSPIRKTDVGRAVQELRGVLGQLRAPVYLLINLKGDATIPLDMTLTSTLYRLSGHPRLAEVLVCGAISSAETLDRRLALLTGRSMVRKFAAEDDALQYLSAQVPSVPGNPVKPSAG